MKDVFWKYNQLATPDLYICIKINKIISPNWSNSSPLPVLISWPRQIPAHTSSSRQDQLFNTSHFKAEINSPIQGEMETTISILWVSERVSHTVTQSHSHTVKMKSEPWAPTGLMTCYIVSIPNLTLTESLMYILCKAGSSKIFNDKICILWNSEKLRNSNIKVTVVSHLLTNYVGQYQWVYWAMHSCQ